MRCARKTLRSAFVFVRRPPESLTVLRKEMPVANLAEEVRQEYGLRNACAEMRQIFQRRNCMKKIRMGIVCALWPGWQQWQLPFRGRRKRKAWKRARLCTPAI